jgi:hypothetical protein
MKQYGFMAALLICGGSAVFSFQEGWMSLGFEFGNYIERRAEGTDYTGAPGFNLRSYSFDDARNVGFFFHWSFLVPVVGDYTEFGSRYDFIFGPGFRYGFSDNLTLHFGVGLDWMIGGGKYTEDSVDYSRSLTAWGIGGDIALKFDLTDSVYINAGAALSCFFLGNESRSKTYKEGDDTTVIIQLSDGKIQDFVSFGIKPYLCIGSNVYAERAKWGKPPRN